MATEEETNTQPVDTVQNPADTVSHQDENFPVDERESDESFSLLDPKQIDLPPYDFNSVWLLLAPLALIAGVSATLAILLMF